MSEYNVGDEGARWDGYSNFDRVSDRYAQSIDDALNAWSWVNAAHAEDARIRPEDAAEARARIQAAAYRLVPEMENDEDNVELYGEILDRWLGEDGFMTRFESISLREIAPGWMHQFIIDIRRAAWELGYLKAGRVRETVSETEDATWAKDAFR